MRANVVIDDALMRQALDLGGFRTKRSAIEAGLHLLVQVHCQQRLRKLRGRVAWQGALGAMRRD
jgi:Arc/MetJ family transcription regulator